MHHNHPVLSKAYPLEEIWNSFRQEFGASGKEGGRPKQPERQTSTLYLDVAERLARPAASWVDSFGALIDPYAHHEASTGTPRFVGTLGQLIGAGRCTDLVETCILSYENCLGRMSLPWNSPEFAIKEMVFAHKALRTFAPKQRVERWEVHWREYNAEASFNYCYRNLDGNFNTFGLTGEFLRIEAGLGGDPELVDRLIAKELYHIDEYGMYHDPKCPMTYHAVVLQQLSLILVHGYRGQYTEVLSAAVRRGAISSLLMQSTVGQAPFGGRSNQFHFNEAQNAALFEAAAVLAHAEGESFLAGALRRAARRGIELTLPWIMETEPWNYLKQGFAPEMKHGTDSSGIYSVYGLLTGSLCGIAASVADEQIPEQYTPAEAGTYVFTIDPEFHKVFAAAWGVSVEIDTKADMEKDATGLGRVQFAGVRPETVLSGSIPANPGYSFAFPRPQHNVAIGPQWTGVDGIVHRLADFSEEISWRLIEESKSATPLSFTVIYEGDFGTVHTITETYAVEKSHLHYSVNVAPVPTDLRVVVPVISTDGEVSATFEMQENSLQLHYRNDTFRIDAENGTVVPTPEENTNRNATYTTVLVTGNHPGRVGLRIAT